MQIYLDHSATTPPRSEVIALMQQVMADGWGNPSSLHHWGNRAAMAIEQARLQVAQLLNVPETALIFTSGGTEANNLAIWGVARRYRQPQHIITSAVEHAAVEQLLRQLEVEGWAVTRLPVDRYGRVSPVDLAQALRSNTVLVSIIFGQSEVGTVQPIEALGRLVRAQGALFHTDAVQVAGRLPVDATHLPIDLLSLSSHKLYGPQGAGALYVRPGVDLVPHLLGGGQESGLRSGTQALPAISGFGLAAELAAAELTPEALRLRGLRDRLFDQLADVPGLEPTGDRLHRLPHHVSFCLVDRGCQRPTGKALVRQMNLAGIAISAGSACHSGQLAPSSVLLAMGYDEVTANSGIRLTLGRSTALADIDWTAQVLRQVLARTCIPQPLSSV